MRSEDDKIKQLEVVNKRLKISLADAVLARELLETLVKMVYKDYVKILKEKKIAISMTEENHCYENALVERVNGILKDKYLLDRTFKDFVHAEKSCNEEIMLYNTRRSHYR